MGKIDRLYETARKAKMSIADKNEQRESFVYGSTKIENDTITREMVRDTASKLSAESKLITEEG